MKLHELKTWPGPFEAVRDGRKTYEIRANDRDYAVGDELLLREWDPVTEKYSGRTIACFVRYMTGGGGEWGLPEGICVLALSRRDVSKPPWYQITISLHRVLALLGIAAVWLLMLVPIAGKLIPSYDLTQEWRELVIFGAIFWLVVAIYLLLLAGRSVAINGFPNPSITLGKPRPRVPRAKAREVP